MVTIFIVGIHSSNCFFITVSFSNIKLKVKVPGVSNQKCNLVYSRHGVILGSGQLCAGGTKGSGACRGKY